MRLGATAGTVLGVDPLFAKSSLRSGEGGGLEEIALSPGRLKLIPDRRFKVLMEAGRDDLIGDEAER